MKMMVRWAMLPAALLVFTSTAWSQTSPVWAGLTAGATFANWTGDALLIDTRVRQGFNFGAFLRIGVNDKLAVEPHVTFVQQGFRYPASDAYNDAWLRLTYLQIPVLARFTLMNRSSVRPFLIGGPGIGFNIGCDFNFIYDYYSTTVACDHPDVMLRVQLAEFSASLGAGVDYRNWTASVRYMQSLKSVLNESDTYPYKVKNRVIVAAISRAFRIGNLPEPTPPRPDFDDADEGK